MPQKLFLLYSSIIKPIFTIRILPMFNFAYKYKNASKNMSNEEYFNQKSKKLQNMRKRAILICQISILQFIQNLLKSRDFHKY